MTIFYCIRFETPPTWRARSPYLYPPGTGSPLTTSRATVGVFGLASGRDSLIWERAASRLAVYRQSVRLGAEPLETHGQNIFFFSQLNTCGHSPYISSSVTWRLVFQLQLLLTLASAFNLGFDSRGIRDHILFPHIRDFPFCRLLRLSRLRWRYSTLPPHGTPPPSLSLIWFCTTYIVSRRAYRKHIRCPAMDICELYRKHLFFCQKCVFIGPLPSNRYICYNINQTNWFYRQFESTSNLIIA
jgi:hypothetical protein